jgi:hypothetical protein
MFLGELFSFSLKENIITVVAYVHMSCSFYLLWIFVYFSSFFSLFTSSELCLSSPMLGIIIVFVYLHCAVSVTGLVTVDSAHK